MVTLFATLGYVPQSVLPSLRAAGVEEVVVFASTKEAKVEAAVKKVRAHCAKADVPFRRVKVPRPYDLEDVANIIKAELDEYDEKDVVFNITGGTKVMAAAAMIVCFLRGVPTEYAQERTMDVIRLPVMKIDLSSQMSKKHRDILRYLLTSEDRSATTVELRKAIGVKRSTISSHVIKLRAKGLVTVETDPRSGRTKVVRAIPALGLLMMGDECDDGDKGSKGNEARKGRGGGRRGKGR